MAKAELEFHIPQNAGWEQLNDKQPGIFQKILSKDDGTGNYTRLMRFEKGADFSFAGVLTHEFWEEVWIIEGSLTDLTLGKTFNSGSYACRPPGMKHGPYRSDTGVLMFEIRYFLNKQASK
jgi:hypothetical protein